MFSILILTINKNVLTALLGRNIIIYGGVLLNIKSNLVLETFHDHVFMVFFNVDMHFRWTGARCSSVVRAFAHGAMCCRIDPLWGGSIELFLVPASAPRLV